MMNGSNFQAHTNHHIMANIFIIHGYGGYSRENWFSSLKEELEKLGHQVIIPDFPNPGAPLLKSWLVFFEKYSPEIDENSIIIGHSLGGAFLLSLLEKRRLKAAFFVATVSGPINHEVDDFIKTFTHKLFNWKKITGNCNQFYVLHSDKDPYIPLQQAESLAINLNTKVIMIKNGGHLNSKAGFKTFPLLLEKVVRVASIR